MELLNRQNRLVHERQLLTEEMHGLRVQVRPPLHRSNAPVWGFIGGVKWFTAAPYSQVATVMSVAGTNGYTSMIKPALLLTCLSQMPSGLYPCRVLVFPVAPECTGCKCENDESRAQVCDHKWYCLNSNCADSTFSLLPCELKERESKWASTSSTAAGSQGCTSRKTRRPQMLIQIAARGASATDSD